TATVVVVGEGNAAVKGLPRQPASLLAWVVLLESIPEITICLVTALAWPMHVAVFKREHCDVHADFAAATFIAPLHSAARPYSPKHGDNVGDPAPDERALHPAPERDRHC